jgi:phospholipase D1/2
MASSEQLMGGGGVGGGGGPRYVKMQSEPSTPLQPQSSSKISSFFSFRQGSTPESCRIFDELPKGTIVSVSRPDLSDISPVQLSYTIEVQYKQVQIRDRLTKF